jgi:hypothetical protein
LVQRIPVPREQGGGKDRIVVTDYGLAAIEQASADGATLIDIARRLGIGNSTLRSLREDESTQVQLAIDRGLARLETEAASQLVTQMRKGNMTATLFLLKGKFGWRDQGPADNSERKAPNVIINLPGSLSPEEYMAQIKIDVEKAAQ